MKILLVNNYFSRQGGAENSTYQTGCILKEKGHKVYFFASDKKPLFEEDYEYQHYFTKFDQSLLKRFFRPYYNFEAERNLDKLLKEIKPDLVHCNNIFYLLSPSIFRACKRNNIPVAITLRDASLFCPATVLMLNKERYCKEKLCLNGSPLNCIKHRCIYKNLWLSLRYTSVFMFYKYSKLFDIVDRFICTSEAMNDLALSAGINPEKLSLVNNFIDDSFFDNTPDYGSGDYFMYVGRLAKEKGVHYILEAFKDLPSDIKLHIVGSGPEEENLKIFAKENNLNNVKFVGRKSGSELNEEYKNCIANILPSNCFETFGLSSVEAFAHGKPVIGSNIGGIPEIVEHNKVGLIFEPGDVKTLTEHIKTLYQDVDLRTKLAKAAREKAEARYTQEDYYNNLIEVYQSILS